MTRPIFAPRLRALGMLGVLGSLGMLAVLPAACSEPTSDGGTVLGREPPRPVPRPPDADGSGMLALENRTPESVTITTRDTGRLRIDRGVIEGRYAVPFPVVAFGPERTRPLPSRILVPFDMTTEVVGVPAFANAHGGIFRVADGPWLFAVGGGRVVIRRGGDGANTTEAEDPKKTMIVPVERDVVPSCEPGALDAPFDEAPDELRLATDAYVTRVDRDAATGCRSVTIGTDAADIVVVRICVPEEAFPFADVTRVRVAGTYGSLRFEDDDAALELTRLDLTSTTATTDGIELSHVVDAHCARIDPECGDVDVPVKLTARAGGGEATPVVAPAALPSEVPDRARWVLGASARLVSNASCAPGGAPRDTMDVPARNASVWLAALDRRSP